MSIRIYGNKTFVGNDISISIAPIMDNNYISTRCANQLVFPKSNMWKFLDLTILGILLQPTKSTSPRS